MNQVNLRLVSIEQTITLALIYVLHLTVYYIVVISKVRKISITVKSSVRMNRSSFEQISMISCIEKDWLSMKTYLRIVMVIYEVGQSTQIVDQVWKLIHR